MSTITQVLSIVAGVTAGVIRSVMGWYEGDTPFNLKLFGYTIVRTGIQGAAIGLGLNQEPLSTFFAVYFTDTLVVNRTINAVKSNITTK